MTPGLAFDAATHTYTYGARVLPSITQVLHATNILRVDPAIPAHRLEFARERGAAVHLAIRFANEGRLDAASLSALIEPYLFAWEAFCAKHAGAFDPLVVEEPLADPVLGFAGTPDAIGLLRDVLAVVEVKTGAEMPAGTAIQTAAQRWLAAQNGHPVVRRYGVQLRPDGTYRLHEYRDPADDAEFKSALFVYARRWAREGVMPHAA